MRLSRLLLTAMGGKAPVVYLLRDEFTTDDDAPITSPRTCEPGPGVLTITDAANKLSISGGQLVRTAGTYKLISDVVTRSPGLAFSMRATHTTPGNDGDGLFGVSESDAGAVDGFASIGNYTLTIVTDSVGLSQPNTILTTGSAMTEGLIIQRSIGAYVFIGGGKYGKWTLLYPGSKSDGTSCRWIYSNGSSGNTGVLDSAKVVQLKSPLFLSDYAFASYHSAAPAAGVNTTASRDSLVEITWTAATDEILEIYLRQVDASNRQIIRCSQSGSTIKLIRVTAGVETEMQSAAQTWTNGSVYTVVGSCMRDGFKVSVNATIKLSQASLVNEFGTIFGADGFTTAANFAVYPLGVSTLPEPYDMVGWRWLLGYGDSKTYDNDTLAYLVDLIEPSTNSRWCYNTIGRSGYTVSDMAAKLTGDLARFTVSSEDPESILINLGTNDLSSLPAEVTWKASYRTIIEALHAKWPSAKIYLAKPVRLGGNPPNTPVAATATMHGYIDDLAGEYAYVFVGMDETNLEGGDSYVTYMVDAFHPNLAGYNRCAALWKTVLGL